MTDSLVRLLAADSDLTAADLADVLWLLAARCDLAALEARPFRSASAAKQDSAPAATPAVETTGSQSPDPVPEEVETPAEGGAPVPVYAAEPAPQPGGLAASRVALSRPDTFGHPLLLARALRPFTRVREGSDPVFDLDASVEATAETRTLVVKFAPETRRRLDVALVMDDAVSVALFDDAVDELAQIFTQVGAFRDVSRWTLVTDAGTEPDWAAAPVRDAHGGLHHSDHLIDPSGRRIVLLVTDFVGAHWSGDRPWTALERWSAVMPTAALHTLPEHYWRDSAIGHASVVTRTQWSDPSPAKPQIRAPRWSRLSTENAKAVPVVALTPETVAEWVAAAVNGTGWTRSALLTSRRRAHPRVANATILAADRIAAFRVRASVEAQSLAEVLALSSRLSMPLIELLRATRVPDAGLTQIAEILVSGLLEPAPDEDDAPGPATGTSSEPQYRFRAGVAEQLRRGTTSADLRAVYDAVTGYVDSHVWQAANRFYAVIADPAGRETLAPELRPFAAILDFVDGRPRRLDRPSSVGQGAPASTDQPRPALEIPLRRASADESPAGGSNDPPGRSPTRDVLVIFVEADRGWAEWIAWALRSAGLGIELLGWEPAERADVALLDRAVRTFRRTLVLLSPSAILAYDQLPPPWAPDFVADPIGRNWQLIPVVVEACAPGRLLGSLVPITLAERDESGALEALIAGLEAAMTGRGRLRSEPAYPGTIDRSGLASKPEFPRARLPEGLTEYLIRVVDAYRDRYPGAKVTHAVSEDGLHYLEIRAEVDGNQRTWPVGVWPGVLDAAAFDRFVEQVHTPFERLERWGESDLVYGTTLADDLLRNRARRIGVRVQSIRGLEQGWDPTRYLARQRARLDADQEYPPDLYVAQRYVRFDEPPGTQPHENLLSDLMSWLDTADPRLVLVLGDTGQGKTFLTRELARRIPDEMPQLTPLLINLRSYEKSHSLDVVLAHHLQESGEDGVRLQSVRRMIDRGQILLIFDGFDELAIRLTYTQAAEHLRVILSAVSGRAKVVMTSRSQQFASDQQWLTALGEQVEVLPATRLVRLASFNDEQALEFVTRLYAGRGDTEGARGDPRRRLALLRAIPDLDRLARTPRMLAFIADLPDDDLIADDTRGSTVILTRLYQVLVDRWLALEAARRRPTLGSLPSLTASQLRAAVTAIAVRMWTTDASTLDLGALTAVIADSLPGLGPTALDAAQTVFAVGSGSLLTRDDTDRFGFVHSSVLEYLVAAVIADQLTASGDSSLARARPMSGLMVDFLVGSVASPVLESWAAGVGRSPRTSAETAPDAARREDPSGIARANARAISSALPLELPIRADLSGQDLRGSDLTGPDLRDVDLPGANLAGVHATELDLSGADLTDADLTDSRLTGLDLRGANLHGANLARAHATDLDLSGADLTDADLTDAKLVRPDLRGANLRGSRWTRAALLAPEIDRSTSTIELDVAAIPGRDPARPVVGLPPKGVSGLVFSPDGTTLVSSAHGDLQVWEVSTGSLRGEFGHDLSVSSVAFAPSGSYVVSAATDGQVRLWKPEQGSVISEFTNAAGALSSVAVSPDETFLAAGSLSGAVWLLNAQLDVVHELAGHSGGTRSVAFAPDSRLLVSGGGDAVVRLWDVFTGEVARVLAGHTDTVSSVAISPGGRYLASGGADGTVRTWGIFLGGLSGVFSGHIGSVSSVAFSPDLRFLASGDSGGTVRIWNMGSGQLEGELTGHSHEVSSVAFSPDGRALASGSADGTIRLWNMPTRSPVATLVALAQGGSATLLPDGAYKYSASAPTDQLWWEIKGVRFDLGELDAYDSSVRRLLPRELLQWT